MAVSLCFYHASFMCSLVLLRDFGKTLDIQYHLKVFSVLQLLMHANTLFCWSDKCYAGSRFKLLEEATHDSSH
jgi:hypothetical protein